MPRTPSPTPLRILIIGGGVIGSVYAGWFQEAGHQVTILARGRRLAELREQGLLIEDTGSGQQLTIPIATAGSFHAGPSPLDWGHA